MTGGAHAYAGYRVTAFGNEEEQQAGMADKARWPSNSSRSLPASRAIPPAAARTVGSGHD